VPDMKLVHEILLQVEKAIETIQFRFSEVDSVDFFMDSPQGEEKLDSICMLLIAIGESLKKIDKITQNKLLQQYDEIDWKAIKGMRDVLSHHYFDINAEAVYDVCSEDIDHLHRVVQMIRKDISQ